MADIPAGTGLGSSGTFTVGLLRALYAFQRAPVTPDALAEEACEIEIDRLGGSCGKQDQYIAAFGGITCLDFAAAGHVRVSPLALPLATLHDLESRLLLFFTGYSPSADDVLKAHRIRLPADHAAMADHLPPIQTLGGPHP